MLKKLLIPLDGSLIAERALKTAVALAAGVADHELILLRVIEAPISLLSKTVSKKVRQQQCDRGQNYLRAIRQSYMKFDVKIQPLVIEGDPASVIIDTAVAENVDLIVMSTHGRSGIARWMFGSVAEKVLQSVPCPIMTIRSEDIPSNILITLDGSMTAGQSLKPGFEIAHRLQAKITLLRVLDSLEEHYEEGLSAFKKPYIHPYRFYKSFNKLAHHELEEVISEYKEGVPTIYFALKEGHPAEGILEYAENHQIELIVMTTHGETASNRWEYGSVTEKVRLKATCNMLVIRPSFQ